MARAYYNENDRHAAEWLRNIMQAGIIPDGEIDTRSIRLVQPEDLIGFDQCHFFAGIGGWGLAARIAGWPDARELWTGSCPCQPFSAAGQRGGEADERHLWPDFLRLISARRPALVMGEQVAGALGYGWFDGVRADLAREAFASRTVDIPALAVNAPHERNRLYWVARNDGRLGALDDAERDCSPPSGAGVFARRNAPHDANERSVNMGDAAASGQGRGELRGPRESLGPDGERSSGQPSRPDGRLRESHMEEPDVIRRREAIGEPRNDYQANGRREADQPQLPYGSYGDFWREAGWVLCHDGKARRTQPGASLMADGVRGRVLVPRPEECPDQAFEGEEARWVSRVGAWKGAGNAIVPQEAAEVIAAWRDVYPDGQARADLLEEAI